MAENFGVRGRGNFYEETGAIRDVIQNHLLQIVSYLAMEAPSSTIAEAIRDEEAKVLRTVRPISADQRSSYNSSAIATSPCVKSSSVPAYAALRLYVDSWRWDGVPFYVRAGKSLQTTATEVVVELKNPPQVVFSEATPQMGNLVRFRLSRRWSLRLVRAPSDPAKECRESRELSVVDEARTGATSARALATMSVCLATRSPAIRRFSLARTSSKRPGDRGSGASRAGPALRIRTR